MRWWLIIGVIGIISLAIGGYFFFSSDMSSSLLSLGGNKFGSHSAFSQIFYPIKTTDDYQITCDGNETLYCDSIIQEAVFEGKERTGTLFKISVPFESKEVVKEGDEIISKEEYLLKESIIETPIIEDPKVIEEPITKEEYIYEVPTELKFRTGLDLQVQDPIVRELKEDQNKDGLFQDGDTYEFSVFIPKDITYAHIGENSIIIDGKAFYNSTDSNITKEYSFAHLNLSDNFPYDQLAGYWNFDVETSSGNTTTYDFSRNSNNGILSGGASRASSGFIDGGMSFGGSATSTAIVNIGNTPSLNFTNNYTIMVWVYPNTSPGVIQGIIHKGRTTVQYRIARTSTGQFFFRDSNVVNRIGATIASANQWYHVTATSIDRNVTLYLNGNVDGSWIQGGLTNSTSQVVDFGGIIGVDVPINGTIDEVMFFNTSLTQSQIQAIYNNQSARFKPKGELTFQNINLGTNDSAIVNISSLVQAYHLGNFSARFSYGTQTSTEVFFVNNEATVNVGGLADRTNMNLSIGLYAGNNSIVPTVNTFYSPVLIGNISIRGVVSNVAPSFFNLTEHPSDPQVYSPTQTYRFNATWLDNLAIDTVKIEFDGVNYSVKGTNNVYNFTIPALSAGVHSYYWWANDSNGATNQTSIQTYTVTKAPTNSSLYLDGAQANKTIFQGDSIYINATRNQGEGNMQILRDGVVFNDGIPPLFNFTQFLVGGNFNFTAFQNDSQNYTASNETWIVTVIPDVAPPTLQIINPAENHLYTSPVNLTIFASDGSGLNGTFYYSFNRGQTNISFTPNTTLTIPIIASYNISVFANDIYNNWARADRFFHVTNQSQGPEGPQGPTGPTGPTGPQGPAGANGTSGNGTSTIISGGTVDICEGWGYCNPNLPYIT